MTEYRAVIDRGILSATKYVRVKEWEKTEQGLIMLVKTTGEEVYYPPKKIKRIEEKGGRE